MGINLRNLGEYESSAEKLRQATEFMQSKAEGFNNLGLTYIEMGDFE
jgi:Flp pilus assembly protein TadD